MKKQTRACNKKSKLNRPLYPSPLSCLRLGLKATLIPAFTATGIALLDILDFNNAHVLD